MTVDGDPEVRAGGGLVWRRGDDGVVQILLVHRPRYDDWTLPKGKCDPDETELDCAVREVAEETGLACSVGDELTPVSYVDHKGRTKRVRYWAMRVEAGAFEPNDEVDRAEWLPLAGALARLSYPHDRPVVAAWAASFHNA